MIIIELFLIAIFIGLIFGGILSKLWVFAVAFLGVDILLSVFFKKNPIKKLNKHKNAPQQKDNPPPPAQNQEEKILHVDQSFFMNGTQFERYVADIFTQLNYKVQIVGGSGDQGIDIIAQKFFCKIGIQAKCYAKPVSNKAIMEALAGKKYYKLSKAVVVTNSIFTPSAKKLAKRCKVKLIDKKDLALIVQKINKK